jgi:undecaprenyl-diphosphatase
MLVIPAAGIRLRRAAVRDPDRGARAPAGREVRLSALEVLRRFDQLATARLRAVPSRGVGHTALSLLSHSADSVVLVPGAALLWWADRFSRGSIAVPLMAGFLLSVVLTTAVKYTVRRRRPRGEWGGFYRRMDPHSFPSGHASRTVTLAVVALAGNLVLAGVLLAAWSLAVGFTRVALGVHFLLDVLAGTVLGLATGLAVSLWVARGMPGLPPFPWAP